MTAQLTVKFFDTVITHDEVKQLLLRSQPGDFYWGGATRPPYLIDYCASRQSSTWSISGALSWNPQPVKAVLAVAPGVTVRLEGVQTFPEQVVTQQHLRQALFGVTLGTVFNFDTYWYRVVKRNIWVSAEDQAELAIVVEPT